MVTDGGKKLTFDQWRALPETNRKCEVVDGVLLMPPSPMWEHQWTVWVILSAIQAFLMEHGLGIALMAPCDVLISREPLRVRQPDILVVNEALSGITDPADFVGMAFLEKPPLLAVEALSPSNTRRELEERLSDYRSIGIPECWLADFPNRTVTVLRLTPEAAAAVATYGLGDALESEVLPGFSLPVADIFGPLLGPAEAT